MKTFYLITFLFSRSARKHTARGLRVSAPSPPISKIRISNFRQQQQRLPDGRISLASYLLKSAWTCALRQPPHPFGAANISRIRQCEKKLNKCTATQQRARGTKMTRWTTCWINRLVINFNWFRFLFIFIFFSYCWFCYLLASLYSSSFFYIYLFWFTSCDAHFFLPFLLLLSPVWRAFLQQTRSLQKWQPI